MLKTIYNTSQLLKLFTLETPEWGISELAKELGWSTSTTHDLATSLDYIGFLKRSGKRRYALGWRVLELSHVVLGSSTLQTEARKGMEEFAARHDETILLGILGGGKILFADKIVSSHQTPGIFSTPDGRFHAHCTAAGKVLMAHSSKAIMHQIVEEHGLKAITPKSIQSVEVLAEELTRVKAQGHAYTFEECLPGIGGVAAPVYDYSGKVVAALSIKASIQQFERHLDEYRSAVLRSANQISTRLGHMAFMG